MNIDFLFTLTLQCKIAYGDTFYAVQLDGLNYLCVNSTDIVYYQMVMGG